MLNGLSESRISSSTPSILFVTNAESCGRVDSARSCVRTLRCRLASLAVVILKFLLKLSVHEISIYIVRRTRPLLDATACDMLSIHTSSASRAPRPLHSLCRTAESLCTRQLMRCTISLRPSAGCFCGSPPRTGPHSPHALGQQPVTPIADTWAFRWHQFFQYAFVMFGPRLGVALLERPETAQLFGLLHYVGLWEGVQRCRRVLHSHGRWRCARTHLALHDAHAGMGFLGLRVDDGVDRFVARLC